MRADDTDNILYHAIHMLDVTFSGHSNATTAFLLPFSGKKYLRQTRLGLVEHTDTGSALAEDGLDQPRARPDPVDAAMAVG